MATYYVGLDVHSKMSAYAIQNEAGELIGRGEVPTTRAGLAELRRKHELPAGTKVGLETGTVSFFVARQLQALELEPIVIDAHEVRLKAHRPTQKSDRRDALEICEGLRRGIYRTIVHVPPPPVAALRETLSRRRHFVRAATSEMNAAKRLLRAAGVGVLARSLGTDTGWEKLIASLPLGELPLYIEQHFAQWKSAREQVVTLEKLLAQQAAPFAASAALLETIDGVGTTIALTAIAVFSDISRFPSAKHAASYAGIVPSTHQSGNHDAHGRITKRGSAELRAMLCQAAHHASRPTHPLNPYFARVCAKRGYKQAVIAVAHRLCRIIFAMLRDKVPFDIAKAGVERGHFERKAVKVYRLKPREKAA